nr:hypothetical protein [Tanacetum cinerariifolium]
MKGWKDKFFFVDRRAIPVAMAWRHHDSDVYDPLSDDDYSIVDVRALAENIIDLCSVHPTLFFTARLATVWEFPGVRPIFKDTRGNVITMSEYLRFPFTASVVIQKGDAIPAREKIVQHTTPPLSENQDISENTDNRWEVEVEDEKVLATKEKKKVQAVRAVAKKKETKRADGGEDAPSKSEDDNADEPLRRSLPREGETPRLEHFVHPEDQPLHTHLEQVCVDESNADNVSRPILRDRHVEEGESALSMFLSGFSLKIMLCPPLLLLRAWSNLAMGALAQADMPKRFENLQDDYSALAETHEECSETLRKLVTARQDLEHSATLYTNMSNRFKELREERLGCDGKVRALKKERNELTVINKNQANRIQELEAE